MAAPLKNEIVVDLNGGRRERFNRMKKTVGLDSAALYKD